MKSKYFAEYILGEDTKTIIRVLAGFSQKTLDAMAQWFEGHDTFD